MADRLIARIDDTWALASDGVQWILQRRHLRRGGDTWDPVSFVRSTRDVLARCMRARGVPDDAALPVLAQLPPTFEEWARCGGFRTDGVVEQPGEICAPVPSYAGACAA